MKNTAKKHWKICCSDGTNYQAYGRRAQRAGVSNITARGRYETIIGSFLQKTM